MVTSNRMGIYVCNWPKRAHLFVPHVYIANCDEVVYDKKSLLRDNQALLLERSMFAKNLVGNTSGPGSVVRGQKGHWPSPPVTGCSAVCLLSVVGDFAAIHLQGLHMWVFLAVTLEVLTCLQSFWAEREYPCTFGEMEFPFLLFLPASQLLKKWFAKEINIFTGMGLGENNNLSSAQMAYLESNRY